MNTSRHKLQIQPKRKQSPKPLLLRRHAQGLPVFLAVGDFYTFSFNSNHSPLLQTPPPWPSAKLEPPEPGNNRHSKCCRIDDGHHLFRVPDQTTNGTVRCIEQEMSGRR